MSLAATRVQYFLEKGRTQSQIARTLKVSRQAVNGIIKKYNLTILNLGNRTEIFRYRCRTCNRRIERTRKIINFLAHPSLCGPCVTNTGLSLTTISCKECGRERTYAAWQIRNKFKTGYCQACWARELWRRHKAGEPLKYET